MQKVRYINEFVILNVNTEPPFFSNFNCILVFTVLLAAGVLILAKTVN